MSRQACVWKFQRLGGMDQLVFDSGQVFAHLHELDPKLWVALSCPTRGLEFDSRTLELIDSDKDGRIRLPEVTSAVQWVCRHLSDPATLIDPPENMPIDYISDQTEQGRRLRATGLALLQAVGKKPEQGLGREDVVPAALSMAGNLFNGDGVIPPQESLDMDMRQFVQDVLNTMGGVTDASGENGVTLELAQAFMYSLHDWRRWHDELAHAVSPLAGATGQAWEIMQQIKPRLDDYFLRCELAAYAPQAVVSLNPDENIFVGTNKTILSFDELSQLPLARIEANKPLNLQNGLNPAWRGLVESFFSLAAGLLDNPTVLTRENWQSIQAAFTDYGAALAHKPQARVVPDIQLAVPPSMPIESLGEERINYILEQGLFSRFAELAEQDANTPGAARDIAELERLVLYHGSLHRLLKSFVSFTDFYNAGHQATFRAGTLYIDGRNCLLCLPVDNVDTHSNLASFSRLYLLYCECRRQKMPGSSSEPEGVRHIVAAVSAGDADLLLDGRNGVFIDNQGYDWDATVIKKISNPVSLREAVWSPYKSMARMLGQQIKKIAGARQDKLMAAAGEKLNAATTADTSPPKFDIARSAGIFAAIGLALGAIGTALATLASALFSLQWWQFPLVILGLFLIISGPSLIMAMLKIRRRCLGPLLEASGWAVNKKVPITLPLARQLTYTATLPANARRSFRDPLRRPRRWPIWALIVALLASGLLGWWWFSKHQAPVAKPAITQSGASQ